MTTEMMLMRKREQPNEIMISCMRLYVHIFLSHKRFSICTNISCITVIIIIWSTHIFHFYGPYWLEFVCVRRPLDLQPNGLNRLLGRRRSGPRSIAALVYTTVVAALKRSPFLD